MRSNLREHSKASGQTVFLRLVPYVFQFSHLRNVTRCSTRVWSRSTCGCCYIQRTINVQQKSRKIGCVLQCRPHPHFIDILLICNINWPTNFETDCLNAQGSGGVDVGGIKWKSHSARNKKQNPIWLTQARWCRTLSCTLRYLQHCKWFEQLSLETRVLTAVLCLDRWLNIWSCRICGSQYFSLRKGWFHLASFRICVAFRLRVNHWNGCDLSDELHFYANEIVRELQRELEMNIGTGIPVWADQLSGASATKTKYKNFGSRRLLGRDKLNGEATLIRLSCN